MEIKQKQIYFFSLKISIQLYTTAVGGRKKAPFNREKPRVGAGGEGDRRKQETHTCTVQYVIHVKVRYCNFNTLFCIQDKCVELVGHKIIWILHFYCAVAVLLIPQAL